ncbi:MAG TPA: ribosome maturation factor RimM [Bdellovibrionota bacterium]|nr:ribosome maturation factor RimM [Bdellovibrionota bacterium]
MTSDVSKWVPVGKVGRAKGLHGELRVELFNPGSEILTRVDDVRIGTSPERTESYVLDHVSLQASRIVVRFEGVETRNDAERLTNQTIFVARSKFPALAAGEHYCVDLIGLPVVTPSGKVVGTLREIWPTASNDIYVVDAASGEILLPATKDVIVKVDMDHGRIVANPPETSNEV